MVFTSTDFDMNQAELVKVADCQRPTECTNKQIKLTSKNNLKHYKRQTRNLSCSKLNYGFKLILIHYSQMLMIMPVIYGFCFLYLQCFILVIVRHLQFVLVAYKDFDYTYTALCVPFVYSDVDFIA